MNLNGLRVWQLWVCERAVLSAPFDPGLSAWLDRAVAAADRAMHRQIVREVDDILAQIEGLARDDHSGPDKPIRTTHSTTRTRGD